MQLMEGSSPVDFMSVAPVPGSIRADQSSAIVQLVLLLQYPRKHKQQNLHTGTRVVASS